MYNTFLTYGLLSVLCNFFVLSWCVNLIKVFFHDDTLVRRPPCGLNNSCTSTTAESRAKIGTS